MDLLKKIEERLNCLYKISKDVAKKKEENPDSINSEIISAKAFAMGTRKALHSFYDIMEEYGIEENEYLNYKGGETK